MNRNDIIQFATLGLLIEIFIDSLSNTYKFFLIFMLALWIFDIWLGKRND